jgi:hypothetical protein
MSKEPEGRGIDCRSPIGFTTGLLIQKFYNPTRIADLIDEEQKSSVLSVIHDDGTFS